MNRCHHRPIDHYLRILLLVVASTAILATNPARAQAVRQFPEAALRGTLVVTAPPEVTLDGVPERLAPGVRIKSVDNLLVMSGSLVGRPTLVNYLRDGQGLIREVWILNQQEALEKRPGRKPTTIFGFTFGAEKPKTDDGKTPSDQLPKYPRQ